MAVEVVMPRLGWTMEEGSVVEWLKRDGDAVRAGEVLFTIESDKAVQECEALDSGILRIPPDSPPPGTPVPIGTVLAYLLQPGEAPPFQRPTDQPPPRDAVPQTAAAPAATVKPALAEAAAEQAPVPRSTGAGVSTPSTQPRSAAISTQPSHDLPTISPRARRVATELGVDWT